MAKYVALLRGINVGGKSLIKMAELKTCVEEAGYTEVKTYINSGNVLFSSIEKNEVKIAQNIEKAIEAKFKFPVRVVVISHSQLKRIIAKMPKGWGAEPEWRYYLLFLLPPYNIADVMTSIGEPKPDIEGITAGEGVVYQATDMRKYGRTTASKIPSKSIYKLMTIRNLSTARKLLELLNV